MKYGLNPKLNNVMCIVLQKMFHMGKNSNLRFKYLKFVFYCYFSSGMNTEMRENYMVPSDVKAKEAKLCPIDTPFTLPGISL